MSQDYDDLMYEEDPCHQHNHGDDSFARINRGERGDEPMPGETFFKCGGCGNLRLQNKDWRTQMTSQHSDDTEMLVEKLLHDLGKQGILYEALTDKDVEAILTNTPSKPMSDAFQQRTLSAMRDAQTKRAFALPSSELGSGEGPKGLCVECYQKEQARKYSGGANHDQQT